VWFGSASQVTLPEPLTLMNLYCTATPAGRKTVPDQSGLVELYCDELRLNAFVVLQLPSAVTLPELQPCQSVFIGRRHAERKTHSLIVSPYEVVASSLKVMGTAVAEQELLPASVVCQ
jgi:hypothetical protein